MNHHFTTVPVRDVVLTVRALKLSIAEARPYKLIVDIISVLRSSSATLRRALMSTSNTPSSTKVGDKDADHFRVIQLTSTYINLRK